MIRWFNVVLLLARRLRRWTNSKTTLDQRIMCAGIALLCRMLFTLTHNFFHFYVGLYLFEDVTLLPSLINHQSVTTICYTDVVV